MSDDFLKDYRSFPKMVHWFNPVLLIKLLNNVVTSAMFGQFADRRLIVAALDTVDEKKHVERATSLLAGLNPTPNDPVWIDFVADLGDGFDSTFAVASLLARNEIELDGRKLPRGQMLIMGGDEVYPLANAQTYRNQLWQPYAWAFPDHDKRDDKGVPLFAIPGNHDWYDGLVQFLAYFTREKCVHFGNWRSRQRRSYFAVQVTKTWWIWAMDIQLAEDMDQPQADYFNIIARSAAMQPNSRIILCTAEPGWLYTDTNTKSWEIVDFAIGIAQQADKNLTVPLLLSGDTHHYSRYEATDGTQFVTSGGGGAFLHPTHQLEDAVSVRWLKDKRDLSLAPKDGARPSRPTDQAVYPPMSVSRKLLRGNLAFAITNWDFSILMGVIYFLVGLLISLRDYPDACVAVAVLMGAGIIGYTTTQEKVALIDIQRTWRKRRKRPAEFDALANRKLWRQFKKACIVWGSSLIHAGTHIAVAIIAARLFIAFNNRISFSTEWCGVWQWIATLFVEMGFVGFFIGSTIFGVNMLVTCRWLRMNRNDAFSALRIGQFNNFVRLRIHEDEVELYAIGLEDVPSRDNWSANPSYKRGDPNHPRWIPQNAPAPHLIERVKFSGATTPLPKFV